MQIPLTICLPKMFSTSSWNHNLLHFPRSLGDLLCTISLLMSRIKSCILNLLLSSTVKRDCWMRILRPISRKSQQAWRILLIYFLSMLIKKYAISSNMSIVLLSNESKLALSIFWIWWWGIFCNFCNTLFHSIMPFPNKKESKISRASGSPLA